MKREDLETLVNYLKDSKGKLTVYFQERPNQLNDYIQELEDELDCQMCKAIYSTECIRAKGGPGKPEVHEFNTIREALLADLPDGCVSGCIFTKDDTYYTKGKKEWELYTSQED